MFNSPKDPVLKLFNLIFISRCTPSPSSLGLISHIYKSGDKMDPDNYRGICVISCLSKLFLLILNQRLCSFVNTYKIVNRSQTGFQFLKKVREICLYGIVIYFSIKLSMFFLCSCSKTKTDCKLLLF